MEIVSPQTFQIFTKSSYFCTYNSELKEIYMIGNSSKIFSIQVPNFEIKLIHDFNRNTNSIVDQFSQIYHKNNFLYLFGDTVTILKKENSTSWIPFLVFTAHSYTRCYCPFNDSILTAGSFNSRIKKWNLEDLTNQITKEQI
jgi:hypothetical protein